MYYTSLARDKRLAVTVTRSCWGLWDTSTGRLLAQLAEAPLGAIVTHAKITPSGEYVVTAESGNILVWDLSEQKVCVHYSKQKPLRILTLKFKIVLTYLVNTAANSYSI